MVHRRWFACVAVVCLMSSAALAASLTGITGSVSVDGRAVSGATAVLNPGQTVNVLGEGSVAVLTTANGNKLRLGPGTELTLESTGEGGEVYVLKRGWVQGTLTTGTTISNGQQGLVTAGEGGSAELFVEVKDGGNQTRVRVRGGSAQVSTGDQFETTIGAEQGATITYRPDSAPRRLGIQTDSESAGEVKVTNRATDSLDIDIYVPAGTTASSAAIDGNTRTEIKSDIDSAKEGRVRVVSRLKGDEKASVEVAPSLSAFVNHASGEITLSYVKLDWTVLARAISLTSEFQTLAVSNFTGVLPPDNSAPSTGGAPTGGTGEYGDDFGYFVE